MGGIGPDLIILNGGWTTLEAICRPTLSHIDVVFLPGVSVLQPNRFLVWKLEEFATIHNNKKRRCERGSGCFRTCAGWGGRQRPRRFAFLIQLQIIDLSTQAVFPGLGNTSSQQRRSSGMSAQPARNIFRPLSGLGLDGTGCIAGRPNAPVQSELMGQERQVVAAAVCTCVFVCAWRPSTLSDV